MKISGLLAGMLLITIGGIAGYAIYQFDQNIDYRRTTPPTTTTTNQMLTQQQYSEIAAAVVEARRLAANNQVDQAIALLNQQGKSSTLQLVAIPLAQSTIVNGVLQKEAADICAAEYGPRSRQATRMYAKALDTVTSGRIMLQTMISQGALSGEYAEVIDMLESLERNIQSDLRGSSDLQRDRERKNEILPFPSFDGR